MNKPRVRVFVCVEGSLAYHSPRFLDALSCSDNVVDVCRQACIPFEEYCFIVVAACPTVLAQERTMLLTGDARTWLSSSERMDATICRSALR